MGLKKKNTQEHTGFKHSWIQGLREYCQILWLLYMAPLLVLTWFPAAASFHSIRLAFAERGTLLSQHFQQHRVPCPSQLLPCGWGQHLWWDTHSGEQVWAVCLGQELQVGGAAVKPRGQRPRSGAGAGRDGYWAGKATCFHVRMDMWFPLTPVQRPQWIRQIITIFQTND